MAENTNQGNPLQKYYRQPKLYFELPSKGRFYPAGVLETTETGEFPVYSMTAKDELAFKTPDALINGQSTVDVIQSCIPNIKNAWEMPSLDLDAALIAIRIATYGETMSLSTTVPGIEEEREFTVDLREIVSRFGGVDFDDTVYIDDLVIKIRPMSYKEYTQSSLKTFEEQRVFSIVNDDNMSEEEKINKFTATFKRLTEMTVGMVMSSIASIQVGEDVVTNSAQIKDFIQNADKKFYTAIVNHVTAQKEKYSVPPMTVMTDVEDRENGAPEKFEVPIVFDQANFFA